MLGIDGMAGQVALQIGGTVQMDGTVQIDGAVATQVGATKKTSIVMVRIRIPFYKYGSQ